MSAPGAGDATDARRRAGRPLVGVGAVLLAADLREVLLIERGTPPAIGRFSIPGGLVERGETLREACLRELREETGLRAELRGEVKILERIIGPGPQPDYHYLIVDFWGFAAGGTLAAGSDVRAACWVPVSDVAALPATHGLDDVVQRALALARGTTPGSPLFEVARTRES